MSIYVMRGQDYFVKVKSDKLKGITPTLIITLGYYYSLLLALLRGRWKGFIDVEFVRRIPRRLTLRNFIENFTSFYGHTY